MASLLGISLLLVRWGFWATESTVVKDAQGMRAVLIAIQTEPAVLVYGAIVFLLLRRFCTPNNHLQMEEMGHGSLRKDEGAHRFGNAMRPLTALAAGTDRVLSLGKGKLTPTQSRTSRPGALAERP